MSTGCVFRLDTTNEAKPNSQPKPSTQNVTMTDMVSSVTKVAGSVMTTKYTIL